MADAPPAERAAPVAGWRRQRDALFLADHPATAALTGMRAWAAMAVVMVHTTGFLKGQDDALDAFLNSGRFGVHAFYLLSGFTIALSLLNGRLGFGEYMKRRVLRIMPLYFLVLAVMFLWGCESYYDNLFGVQNDLWGLLVHVTLFNLVDLRYANNLVGVEWSIAIEFFYYLVIPLMLVLLRRNPAGILLLLATAALAATRPLMPGFLPPGSEWFAKHWSFQYYAWLYAIAVYAAFHKRALERLLVAPLRAAGRVLFANPLAIWLGNISFSIYLLHVPFYQFVEMHLFRIDSGLDWLAFAALLYALCSITYLAIEKPFMGLARRR